MSQRRVLLRTLVTLCVAAFLAACGASTTPSPNGPGQLINVLGAENFYADLLAQIGGNRVRATSILNDPNADPHAYEASPSAAAAVADAKVVVVNGIGYDDFMQKLLSSSNKPDRIVINVQQLLGLTDDVNVHIWYEPKTMPRVADAVATALARIDPQNGAYFDAQKERYLTSLKAIDDKIAALRTKYSGMPIAFTEDVAGYMTDDIGLRLLTPLSFMRAIEQGIDPAPADVAAERDLITGHKVKALLYNSQVTSPVTKDIHDLAERNNVPIVGVAETIPGQYRTYQEWMLGQLGDLERALAK